MARKNYVDTIKAMGIFLVILGHINFANEAVKSWIYAFHMPLFFFSAGLVMKRETLGRGFFEKKFRGLLVPYFLWGLIYSGYSHENLACLLYGSYQTISRAGSLTSLWFLPVMFLGLLLVQLFFTICEKPWLAGLAGVGMFVAGSLLPRIKGGYPWCLDVVLLAAAFIIFGWLFERLAAQKAVLHKGRWLGFCAAGFALTLTWQMNPAAKERYVLMAGRRIGDPLLFFLAAAGGCLMVYGLARLLEAMPVLKRPLSFCGTNTLVIFAVQKPVIAVFEKVFYLYRLPEAAELLITGVGTLAASCGVCVLVNRFAPCLAGGGHKPASLDKSLAS